jgi:hypothetical protein
MSRNPYRTPGPVNLEWGSKARKARKEETANRGLNHTADRAAIEEQINDHNESEED